MVWRLCGTKLSVNNCISTEGKKRVRIQIIIIYFKNEKAHPNQKQNLNTQNCLTKKKTTHQRPRSPKITKSAYVEAKITLWLSITTHQRPRPPRTNQTAHAEAKITLQSSITTQWRPRPPRTTLTANTRPKLSKDQAKSPMDAPHPLEPPKPPTQRPTLLYDQV